MIGVLDTSSSRKGNAGPGLVLHAVHSKVVNLKLKCWGYNEKNMGFHLTSTFILLPSEPLEMRLPWEYSALRGLLLLLLLFEPIVLQKKATGFCSFKGVLHPRPVFGLFLHFSQKLQHIGIK